MHIIIHYLEDITHTVSNVEGEKHATDITILKATLKFLQCARLPLISYRVTSNLLIRLTMGLAKMVHIMFTGKI